MIRVARALVVREFIERTRDRWVLVISVLFALLAAGVSLYARGADTHAAYLAGPSLVTLTSLLVPLVALILGHDAIAGERERNTLGLLLSLPISKLNIVVAKFLGRLVALATAIGVGLGVAVLIAPAAERGILLQLFIPTLLLGAAFLAAGLVISASVTRLATATSLVVACWFVFVFFYDLGLLALLVGTDGAIGDAWIARLVELNPVGLYRMEMMATFAGPAMFQDLGIDMASIQGAGLVLRWSLAILIPLGLSGLLLSLRKVER